MNSLMPNFNIETRKISFSDELKQFYFEKLKKILESIYDVDLSDFSIEDSKINIGETVSSNNLSKCIYKIHFDFKNDKFNLMFRYLFKINPETNEPFIYHIDGYSFYSKIKDLSVFDLNLVELYIPETTIRIDDNFEIIDYSFEHRICLNESDEDENPYIILDFEYIMKSSTLMDFILVVNYHNKDNNPSEYAEYTLTSLNNYDLLKLSYFSNVISFFNNKIFCDIFNYFSLPVISVNQINIIYEDIINNFNKEDLDKKFEVFKMITI